MVEKPGRVLNFVQHHQRMAIGPEKAWRISQPGQGRFAFQVKINGMRVLRSHFFGQGGFAYLTGTQDGNSRAPSQLLLNITVCNTLKHPCILNIELENCKDNCSEISLKVNPLHHLRHGHGLG